MDLLNMHTWGIFKVDGSVMCHLFKASCVTQAGATLTGCDAVMWSWNPKIRSLAKSEVLRAELNMCVFCDVMTCWMVNNYRRFEKAYFLQVQYQKSKNPSWNSSSWIKRHSLLAKYWHAARRLKMSETLFYMFFIRALYWLLFWAS